MWVKRGFVFLFLAIVPGLTATEAQRSRRSADADPTASGELGYVSGDGIVLSPHPSFATASQAVSGAADKEYSKWKTCMSGMDLGMAFKLHDRAAMARYRRNPEQFCGPEPREVSTGTAETFQIRDTVYSISEGRRVGSVVANFSFTTGNDELVSGSDQLAGRCMVLTNSAGSLIAVRSGRGGDAYTFANPFQKNADPVSRYQAQAQQLSDQLSTSQSHLANLRDQLAGSRAWRGNQCVRPAAGAIPPRPTAMSDTAIANAAKGFCTDLSMRRLPETDVRAALKAIYKDDYITARQAWVRGAKPQCAVNIRSQVDDQMAIMARYLATYLYYGAIQNSIAQCEAIATSACRAPLSNWQSQVAAINAGPTAELNQCRNLVSQISARRAEIESTTPQLEQARSNLTEARAQPQQEPQRLPLSQARCR